MPIDHMRYDILVQAALRGMVRDVLADTAKKGLIGDHHFFISFDTTANGVKISERLHAQYPEEMMIVLQHQFWDLKVTDSAFEVGLSFGGVAERLQVPLDAITSFADPSVQFTLQFETLAEPANETDEIGTGNDKGNGRNQARPNKASAKSKGATPARGSVPATPHAAPTAPDDAASPNAPQPGTDNKTGAEVVRLDRFRKK